MSPRSRVICFAVAAGFASALLAGCGGSSSNPVQLPSQSSPPPISSPTYVSAGDAPMANVLAAEVTFSAITATDASGNSVSLLAAPATLDLAHLGGARAPIAVGSLGADSFASISYTISGVTVSYVDGTGTVQPNVAATLSCGANTTTCTFTPAAGTAPATVAVTVTLTNAKGPAPLVVGDSTATDVGLEFNLASALDLTGTTVTFTPNATVSASQVENEAAPPTLELDGTVSSANASNNSVILKMASGVSAQEAFTTGALDDNLTVAAVQPGTVLYTKATLNTSGSFTATTAEDPNGGVALGTGDEVVSGIVTATTVDNTTTPPTLTSVTVVPNQSTNSATGTADLGTAITIPVASTTLIKDTAPATAAGLATFDQTQVFPGQSVMLAWTDIAATKTAPASMIADEIRPAPVSTSGTSASAVTATSGVSSFTLVPDPATNYAAFVPIATETASANAATSVNVTDGSGNSYTSAAALATGGSGSGMPTGTTVTAQGYLSSAAGAYTLFLATLGN